MLFVLSRVPFLKYSFCQISEICLSVYSIAYSEGHHYLCGFIYFASPCSGHDLKHSAAIGEVLAELALDSSTRYDISALRLDRFRALGFTRKAPIAR
jgi:hypothetical protein